MQELIKTTSTPAVLNVNFEELKKHLAAELEKYEILVTAETLPDAKKLCTELNKTAAEIDTRRKFEVAAVSEPIKHFDANMKKLVTMCKDGRTLILDQVKKFEDETRKLAFKLLEKYRAEMFEKYQVEQEFFRCEFDDLIKLSSVTGKGKLAGSAKKELEMRVLADKSIQDRTKNRLLMLENASLKAGLVATLTKDHVKHFLFAEDFKYESELERILGVEVDRQKATEAATRDKVKKETLQAHADAQSRLEESAEVTVESKPEPARESEPEPEQASEPTAVATHATANINWLITCDFELNLPPSVTPNRIEASLRAAMEKAGIKSLTGIKVVQQQNEVG